MSEFINNQHNADERDDQQLRLIEYTIKALLTGISPEDLTTSQRLNFAAKLLLPYVRMVALQYNIHREQQSVTDEKAFLDDLRQQLHLSLEEVTVDAPPARNYIAE
jgi:hypothetical protein